VRRTPRGFALAIFAGVLAGIFFEPALGRASIILGMLVATVMDATVVWRARRRARREAAGEERWRRDSGGGRR